MERRRLPCSDQASEELEFSVRIWKGKYSLQDHEEELMLDLVSISSKKSSFSGASHPLEPIDMDLMKKSQSLKGSFLDDHAIKDDDDDDDDDDTKECVWDASLPPSANVSPHSSLEGNNCESAKTSVSSNLSDDSNWTSTNKPHQGNDPIWKAISGVGGRRRRVLGMGDFRLLRRLGCGDIGSVYLSELSGTKCYFAMKVMDRESLLARKKLNRAETEREILELLDHPFLPTLYAHFETERFLCLVMELCPGGDLHSLRQRQPGKRFPESAARFYAAEVLLALEYLHMLGVIYRDLKPENVLVREDGHIMLSDFDLSLRCAVSPTLIKGNTIYARPACIEPSSACMQPACFLPGIFPRKNKKKTRKSEPRTQPSTLPELLAEPTQARSMSFVGTHEYLAPEIIKGEGHGSAVDWWTFGVFLHELLYGRTPFKGTGNRATLFNVVGQQLKIPDSPPTSHASRDLIRALVVKEPQNRLGVKRGATEIKQHPFFEGVNWPLIRSSTPPLIPRPVELESPVKPGVVAVDPVGVCGASKEMVDTEMKAGGGKFLDFEFF